MRASLLLLLLVTTATAANIYFVEAEKETLQIHDLDDSSKYTRREGGLRYLKSDSKTGAVGEEEDRGSLHVVNRLKSVLGLKSSKLKSGQAIPGLSSTEINAVEKAANEIRKTKVTVKEAKNLQKATSYVKEGKLTQKDLDGIQKTARKMAKNLSRWRASLNSFKGALFSIVVIIIMVGLPVTAILSRGKR